MSFNVMDMLKDQITPANIDAISGLLGENSSLVSKALSGAGPALLSGLVGSLSKPEGKQVFEQQLEAADDGMTIVEKILNQILKPDLTSELSRPQKKLFIPGCCIPIRLC